jgi:putative zinc finger protein
MNISMDPNPMSHEDAVRNQMAEHFALGELTREDRERFEAHFFDCGECYENVRLASEFLHHTHRVLSPEHEKGHVARFLADLWRPAPRVMASLFLGVVGISIHQQMQISNLRKPEQEQRVYLTELTRSPGKEKEVSVPRGQRLALEAGFVPKDDFKAYRSLILSEPDKRIEFTVPLHLAEDEVSATIVLPPEILHEGTYSMLIQGQQKDGQWKALEQLDKEAGGVFHIRTHGS